MIRAGAGEQVGNECAGLGDPLAVPDLRLKGGRLRGRRS
jgi:hypothetical protein